MTSAEVTERAVAEVLETSVPAHLRNRITVAEARHWLAEHLDRYDEEKARFPGEPLLPWHNWLAYDSEWENTFFVVFIIHEAAIELFCGTGVWPDIRHFGEREANDIPVPDWYREWASRFTVPCPQFVVGKAAVKEWLGRDW